MRNFSIDGAIKSLLRKDCIITDNQSVKTKDHGEIPPYHICVINAKNLGNGSWAKIDFLVKSNYRIFGKVKTE